MTDKPKQRIKPWPGCLVVDHRAEHEEGVGEVVDIGSTVASANGLAAMNVSSATGPGLSIGSTILYDTRESVQHEGLTVIKRDAVRAIVVDV